MNIPSWYTPQIAIAGIILFWFSFLGFCHVLITWVAKESDLDYWTCARSLWGYVKGDPNAVKKLRWVKNLKRDGNTDR